MVFLHLSPGRRCSIAIIWPPVVFNLKDLAPQIVFINVSEVEAELFSQYSQHNPPAGSTLEAAEM